MTDEMLELARRDAAEAGVTNVEFLKGQIEAIPLPDATADLSTDKSAVLAEAFRVLEPGGRFGVSDVVAEDHLTAADRAERGQWVGCIAGALTFTEYREGLAAAGFTDVTITRSCEATDGMHSAIVKATRPRA
jgi:arsenite methyltransferase